MTRSDPDYNGQGGERYAKFCEAVGVSAAVPPEVRKVRDFPQRRSILLGYAPVAADQAAELQIRSKN